MLPSARVQQRRTRADLSGLSIVRYQVCCSLNSYKTVVIAEKAFSSMTNEADTCRRFVVPQPQAAGWADDPHRINEQVTFTDGRIIVSGRKGRRRPGKRADYILRYRQDFPIAIVEAKASYAAPGDSLQQAKDYAVTLGLMFAYFTNGHGIIEFDFITGTEVELTEFPTPDILWQRLNASEQISNKAAQAVLAPAYHLTDYSPGYSPGYYQEIAINRAVQVISSGRSRSLLTVATGTGKTVIAFQIC